MNFFKPVGKTAVLVLTLVVIIAITFFVSYWLELWYGYPRGADALSHVFRAQHIRMFWPNFNWVHAWAGGMPLFLWYPSLLYILVALSQYLSGQPMELLLSIFGVASVALGAAGVYLLAYELTRNYLLAGVSALIYLTTPATWAADFAAGLYSRGLSIGFLGLAIWAVVWWVRTVREKKEKRASFVLTVIFTALAFVAHYNGGPQAFFAVGVVILFALDAWKERLKRFLQVMIPAGLLTSIFTIPLILMRSPSTSFVAGHKSFPYWDMFTPLGNLFYFFTSENIRGTSAALLRLSPFLIPLIIALLALVLIFKRQRLGWDNFNTKIFWSFAFLSVLLLVYATVQLPYLKHYGSGIFDPRMAPYFMPIFMAPMVAILWHNLFPRGITSVASGLVLLVALGGWFFIQLPPTETLKFLPAKLSGLSISGEPNPNQFNFRLGTGNYSNIAGWWNNRFPFVPQTRDYFSTGVVNPDYYVYLVLAGWKWPDNYQEVNYLFDWWAVKRFVVFNNEEEELAKFKKKPDDYSLLGDNTAYTTFEFKEPSPILTTSSVPSVLAIGKNSHNTLFRALAHDNFNSQYLISIKGKELVDDYSLVELKQFKVLMLFNFRAHDPRKAINLIKSYLEVGGNVYIETYKDLASQEVWQDILPVEQIKYTDFGKVWDLKQESDQLPKIEPENFSPAIFDNMPWGVGFAEKLKSGSETILSIKGYPVMVLGQQGQGRIVWSGLNLPYHIITYNNRVESKLFGELLMWLAGHKTTSKGYPQNNESLVYETNEAKIEFINPEQRRVTLKKPSTGVLFKEAWFQNWHAKLNGKEVGIYEAGPGFIYVPISKARGGDLIVFEYKKSFLEWASAFISVTTGLGLILWFFNWWILKNRTVKLLKLRAAKIAGWWGKEE